MGVGWNSEPRLFITPLRQFTSLQVSEGVLNLSLWWHLSCNSIVHGCRMELWTSGFHKTPKSEPQLLITPLLQFSGLWFGFWVSKGFPACSYKYCHQRLTCHRRPRRTLRPFQYALHWNLSRASPGNRSGPHRGQNTLKWTVARQSCFEAFCLRGIYTGSYAGIVATTSGITNSSLGREASDETW